MLVFTILPDKLAREVRNATFQTTRDPGMVCGVGGELGLLTGKEKKEKKIKDPHKHKRITFIFLKIKYFKKNISCVEFF